MKTLKVTHKATQVFTSSLHFSVLSQVYRSRSKEVAHNDPVKQHDNDSCCGDNVPKLAPYLLFVSAHTPQLNISVKSSYVKAKSHHTNSAQTYYHTWWVTGLVAWRAVITEGSSFRTCKRYFTSCTIRCCMLHWKVFIISVSLLYVDGGWANLSL